MMKSAVLLLLAAVSAVTAFAPIAPSHRATRRNINTVLFSVDSSQSAKSVSGEELELMMADWDMPLVVDAYATWCGPCLLMAPEFESAAKELEGKVRFAKLDTDKNEKMAARLNIQGLPTLLFLDKFEPKEGDDSSNAKAKAVLKGRIEGAMRKDTILELSEYYFFDGPEPQL